MKTKVLIVLIVLIILVVSGFLMSFIRQRPIEEVKVIQPKSNFGFNEPYTMTAKDFRWMGENNVGWLRQPFNWPNIEPIKGMFNFWQTDFWVSEAAKNNVAVLPILMRTPAWAGPEMNGPARDLNDWSNFVKKIVGRYKDRVKYWEIWNEPDSQFFQGTPEQYAEVLKVAYKAIKETDPEAQVLIGGVADLEKEVESKNHHFLKQVLDAGAGNYFDVFAFHGYGGMTPQDPVGPAIRAAKKIRDEYNGKWPLWITEFGVPTGGKDAFSEEEQAKILEKAIKTCHHENVPLIWHRLHDLNPAEKGEREASYGIIRFDGTHKPAYDVLLNLLKEGYLRR